VGFRRPTPYGNQTDYRIFELNKRLQNWTEVRLRTELLHPGGGVDRSTTGMGIGHFLY